MLTCTPRLTLADITTRCYDTVRIVADAYEDAGDYATANALRYLADHKLWPNENDLSSSACEALGGLPSYTPSYDWYGADPHVHRRDLPYDDNLPYQTWVAGQDSHCNNYVESLTLLDALAWFCQRHAQLTAEGKL